VRFAALAVILARRTVVVEAEFPATASRVELLVYLAGTPTVHRVRGLRPEA
jgi:hypothetical protein